MNDITIKVERKVIILPLILLIFVSIFFITFLIFSIIYKLMGYYVYFIIIFPFIFIRLYLEIKWLNDVSIVFKKDKLLLNIFSIKKASGKFKENFYHDYRPFTRYSYAFKGYGYVTSYAYLNKIKINYQDITSFQIVKNRDLEIMVGNKKYLVMSSFFHYQNLRGKWRSVYKQFSKEQIYFIYDEIKKRENNKNN